MKHEKLSEYAKEWLKNKENEKLLMDYIFGKIEENPFEEVRKYSEDKNTNA